MSAENAVPVTKCAVTMEKLVNLCKRRGIVFPTSDIYGDSVRLMTMDRSASS